NKFLANIREVDAICHVVRTFENSDITHVANKIDPESDIETINLELIMADLATVGKRLDNLKKETKGNNDPDLNKKIQLLEKIKIALDNGQLTEGLGLTDEEKLLIRDLNLLTIKPVIYALNVAEKDINNPTLPLPKICQSQPDKCVSISAKTEADLADLSLPEAREYLNELGLIRSGLDQLIASAYKLLNLITYLTTGPAETRAWTVVKGAKSPQAAGEIHTDFEKGFIKADVIDWQDLVKAGSESAARDQGLIRLEGKEYVVQDGDVIHFKIG
ncbi:MAG TPA: redox-regulated ATPase YchF, partial [Patescibacteria group bacterium]